MIEGRSKFGDETCANGPLLSESTTIRSARTRIGKFIARYWTAFVVVAIALLLWAPRLSGPIDLRWDAGVYYVLGTSLATGHGYRILSEPGSPEALQYPPLLPAFVALYQRALGSTDPAVVAPWLRISYAVLFLVYALAVLTLARACLQPWLALVAAMLCLLQITTIVLSDLLFPELPFAAISVVFALIAVNGPRSRLRETASFALAAAGFLLRTAGVALLAVWVIEALARCRWRLAIVRGVLALLPVIAWQAHVVRVHRSYEYKHPAYEYQRAPYQNYNVAYAENMSLLDPFRPERGLASRGALAVRLVTNVAAVPAALGEAVSTRYSWWRRFLLESQRDIIARAPIPSGIVSVPIFGLGGLALGGLIVFIFRRDWMLAGIPLLSIALICLTPWPEEFGRYLMPLSPFLTIAVVLASKRLEAMRHTRRGRWTSALGRVALTGLLVITFAVQAYTALTLFRSRGAAFVNEGRGKANFRYFNHNRPWCAWEQAAAWIGARALPSEIVATIAPHQFYLHTGLRAVYPPMDADAAHARRLLVAVPVSYVIVDEFPYRDFSRRYALPAVNSDPAGWHLVHSIDSTQIYERAHGGR